MENIHVLQRPLQNHRKSLLKQLHARKQKRLLHLETTKHKTKLRRYKKLKHFIRRREHKERTFKIESEYIGISQQQNTHGCFQSFTKNSK